MLHDSRFAAHFEFYGNFERHTAFFPAAAWGFPMTTTSMTAGQHEPVDAVSDGARA